MGIKHVCPNCGHSFATQAKIKAESYTSTNLGNGKYLWHPPSSKAFVCGFPVTTKINAAYRRTLALRIERDTKARNEKLGMTFEQATANLMAIAAEFHLRWVRMFMTQAPNGKRCGTMQKLKIGSMGNTMILIQDNIALTNFITSVKGTIHYEEIQHI